MIYKYLRFFNAIHNDSTCKIKGQISTFCLQFLLTLLLNDDRSPGRGSLREEGKLKSNMYPHYSCLNAVVPHLREKIKINVTQLIIQMLQCLILNIYTILQVIVYTDHSARLIVSCSWVQGPACVRYTAPRP